MYDLLIIGEPIPVENFFIHPFTIKEVLSLGEDYFKIISPLLMNEEDFEIPEVSEYSFIQIIGFKSQIDKKFQQMISESLEAVTREKVTFDGEYFRINNTFITNKLWSKIREIIVEQNMLDEKSLRKKPEEDFNPGNEKALEMQEKFKKSREKINKAKEKKGKSKNPYLVEALNNFCSKSPNTNLLQVKEFTLFMFWSQYSALINTDTYDKQTHAVFAGADPKKMKAPHWAEQKIKKEE